MVARCQANLPMRPISSRAEPVRVPNGIKLPVRGIGTLFRERSAKLPQNNERMRFSSQKLESVHYPRKLIISSLTFPLTINAHSVRLQHTATNAPEEPSAETPPLDPPQSKKDKDESWPDIIKRQVLLLKQLYVMTSSGAFAALLSVLLYLILHSDKNEWVDVIERIYHLIKESKLSTLERAYEDLKIAEELLEEMTKLRRLMGGNGKDFEDIIRDIVSSAKILNNKKLEDKEKEKRSLRESLELDCEKRVKTTVDSLNSTWNSRLEVEKNQLIYVHKSEEGQKTQQISELEKQMQNLEEQLKNSQQDGNEQINKLKLLISLYQQCKLNDQSCSVDIHKTLNSKTEIEFPVKHVFSKDFLFIFEKALQSNANSSAKRLKLYGTYIRSDEGLVHLMNGFSSNTTIQSLNISWTDINSNDVPGICRMLKTNNTLQELNLSHSSLKDSDVDLLYESLKNNRTLKKLDLTLSGISKTKIEQLRERLKDRDIHILV